MIRYRSILLIIACVFTLVVNAQEAPVDDLRVTGRVLDASTLVPLPGMRLSVPGVSAAMTGNEGGFSLRVPSKDAEITVTGPGYQQKLVAVKGRDHLEVFLHEEGYNTVFKSVLTPLGEVNNSHLTNSVSMYDRDNSLSVSISGEELLQGNIAGLNVLLRSGMDGAGGNMYIRGFNSIYANSQPLLVIDGMTVENQSTGVSLIDGFLSTPLGAIDVKDIQRITVIKDGTSLYGVKGGNGVILVETLRSKEMATKIDIRAMGGMNMTPSRIPVLSASDYRKYLVDLYQSAGYTGEQVQNLPFINQEKPKLLDNGLYEGNTEYYRYNQHTNWQDELFTESFKQNYSLTVTGGDNIAVYALALGYQINESLIKGNDYSRFNARVNTDIEMTDRLSMRSNMSFVYGKRNLTDEGGISSTNPIYAALMKSPFLSPNVYDTQGNVSPKLDEVDTWGFSNPNAITENAMQENSNYGFLGSVELRYKVWRELNLSSLVGLRFYKERERIFLPENGIAHADLPTSVVTNSMQQRVERMMSLSNETRANYLFKFAHNHSLDATLGFRYQHNKAEDDWAKGYNSPSDEFVSLGTGLNALSQIGGSIGSWNWMALYAHASYNLKNRYFLSAAASFDASSRYGEDIGTFQLFPSISGAWLLSSEKFMRDADFIDLFKVRAGYSVSGNDDIGNYTSRHYYTSQNLLGQYGLIRGNIVNTNLGPERVGKLGVGVDMAFLKERLSLSVDLYKTTVKDMIAYSPVSRITGFHTYISNDGEMQNKGVDLALSGRLIDKAVKWDLGITASFYQNKVTKIPASYETDFNGATILTRQGSPLGLFYGYKTDGIYTTTQAAQDAGLHYMDGLTKVAYQAGDVKFINQNSDDLIDEEDRVVIGDPNPDVYGGINTNLRWKRLSFSALFTYSIGNDIYNYTRQQLESMSGFGNQTEAVLNRWRVEGQQTDIPRVFYGDPMGNSRFSDRWIEDGSYLKLKNLTLAYDIPVRSGVFTGLQVYGVAENLFTLTSYKGYDPEFSGTASPLGYGIDAFITPRSRTFYVGIKIGL